MVCEGFGSCLARPAEIKRLNSSHSRLMPTRSASDGDQKNARPTTAAALSLTSGPSDGHEQNPVQAPKQVRVRPSFIGQLLVNKAREGHRGLDRAVLHIDWYGLQLNTKSVEVASSTTCFLADEESDDLRRS